MTTQKTVLLVRHGETEWNLLAHIQGSSDIELTENGKEQAIEVANRLKKDVENGIVYSSPLKRAVYTANAISNNNTIIHEGLTEMDFVSWEGHKFSEFVDTELYKKFLSGEDGGPFGDSGNTIAGYKEKNRKLIDELSDKHEGKTIILVSHGAWIKCAILGLMEMDPVMYHHFEMGNT